MTKFDEFITGWKVVGRLVQSSIHNLQIPDKSYLLGWWWEGENVLIPELIAEEETANQLEELFPNSPNEKYGVVDYSKIRAGKSIKVKNLCNEITLNSNGTSYPDVAVYCAGNKVTLSQSESNAGTWYLTPYFGIGLRASPHPLRRLVAFLILGMTWEPKPTPPTSIPPTPLSVLKSRL